MSAPRNNGGPAFPVNTSIHDGQLGHQTGNTTWQFPGMTLRDYFAGLAMQGAFTSPIDSSATGKDYVAEQAYLMADAMLKARSS